MADITPVIVHLVVNKGVGKWVVSLPKWWGLAPVDTAWMEDSMLSGDKVYTPEIDIKGDTWVYDTEREALRKVAELYAEQLQKK